MENLLLALTKIIGQKCEEIVQKNNVVGSDRYHLESVKRIKNPDGTDSPWFFEVVSYSRESEDSTTTHHLNYQEMIQKVSYAIAASIMYEAAIEIEKHEP